MAQILIAIEGANLGSLNQRRDDYRRSFVHSIHDRASNPKMYFSGPGAGIGQDFDTLARQVTEWIRDHSAAGDALHFVGYSRGAAACLTCIRALCPAERDEVELPPPFAGRMVVSLSMFDVVANRPMFPEAALRRQESHIQIFNARRGQDLGNLVFPRLAVSTPGAGLQERTYFANHTEMGGHNRPNGPALTAYDWICERLGTVGIRLRPT